MSSLRRNVALVVSLALAACADDADGTSSSSGDPGSTSSSSAGGGDATSSSASSGSTTSSSSSSGAGGGGGEGGQAPMAAGAPGQSLVNAGTTMSSPGYKLVFTQGQSSPQQGQSTSPGYRLRGGLTGATH